MPSRFPFPFRPRFLPFTVRIDWQPLRRRGAEERIAARETPRSVHSRRRAVDRGEGHEPRPIPLGGGGGHMVDGLLERARSDGGTLGGPNRNGTQRGRGGRRRRGRPGWRESA